MRLSKYCSLILILLIGLVMGCRHEKPIDEVFRWPTSGVPEADSLILEKERRGLELDTPVKGYKDIEASMCSLAVKYPDNKLLHSRARYLQFILLDESSISNDSLLRFIANEKAKLDSIKNPYDWHKWTALEINIEANRMSKYLKATDNMLYFKKTNNIYELGRSYIQLGTIMTNYYDTIQAKYFYRKAEEIYRGLGQKKNIFICQQNLASVSSKSEREDIFLYLMTDSTARKFGQLQIWIMQNYFLSTGKVEYLDSALQIANNKSYFSDCDYIEEIPFIFALKGNYYNGSKKEPEIAKQYILRGFDSIKNKDYPARYLHVMYQILGSALCNSEEYKNAANALYQSILWRDSLDTELQQAHVSALDAKKRIELAEQNIRQQRDFWIWGLIAMIIVIMLSFIILMINHKRKQAIKEYQQLLVEQKLQKSLQSVQIQTMVIEENEKFIDEITDQINSLQQSGEIDMTSAGMLTKIMKLHKNDNKAHKGLLELQQELDNKFMYNLKQEYPNLTEGQLKLASLIAIGTESPQICSILGIQMSSLHKSRYRLRSRLCLKNDESLEDFLRNRNKLII